MNRVGSGGGGTWLLADELFEYRDHRLGQCAGPQGNERILAYGLMEDRSGQIWAGIGNGIVLCRRGAEWRPYDQTQGVPYAYITSMAQGTGGTIWAGSLDDGLYRFRGGRFYAIRKEDGGLWWGGARALLCWRNGRLWGCYTNETWVKSGAVTALCEGRGGALRVGTSESKLVRWEKGRFREFGGRVARGPVTALAEQPDGSLWIRTVAGGLKRVNPDNGQVQSVTNGLLS